MANPRFVLTGGPGAGKTTALEALSCRGYVHAPDSARSIIRERKARGLAPRPPLDTFGREILERDIRAYRTIPAQRDPVFFERGVVDALSLIDRYGRISGDEIESRIEAFRYNEMVFVLRPWEEIYRTDGERDQSYPESLAICEDVIRWYARWGYRTIEVPRAPVEERADFILDAVHSRSPSSPG